MIAKEELAGRIRSACRSVRAAEAELTDIDSRFGDADHGVTMVKICDAIEKAVTESEGSIQEMLDAAASAVLELNGGASVPLWNTWLDALQESAPDSETMSETELKAMFSHACEELADFSGAGVGDKTMMDALIPASEAIAGTDGDIGTILRAAAEAAENSAESTRTVAAKFGRAKTYGAKTIGTPDAGAVSMARFFAGLAEG